VIKFDKCSLFRERGDTRVRGQSKMVLAFRAHVETLFEYRRECTVPHAGHFEEADLNLFALPFFLPRGGCSFGDFREPKG